MVNALAWLPVELQVPKGTESRDIVVAHAAEIRKSMDRFKGPELIISMAADLAKIQSEVAWDKCGQDMANVNETCLVVNATTR